MEDEEEGFHPCDRCQAIDSCEDFGCWIEIQEQEEDTASPIKNLTEEGFD